MKKLLCWLLVCNLVLLMGRSVQDLVAGAAGHGAGAPTVVQNGDVNGDGGRDISDAISLLNWLFSGGPEPVACAGGNPDLESRVIALESIVYGCFNFIDSNGDSVPDCAQPDVDSDLDGFPRQDDCDDNDRSVFPGAQEICDHRDNNCNGQVDENVDFQTDISNCGACGVKCGMGETCQNGQCLPIAQCSPGMNGQPCDDGNACTVSDVCIMGQCVGTQRSCDDGNPCTTDTCQGAAGNCVNTNVPNGTDCAGGRVCINGQCTLQDADLDGFPVDMDCDDTNAAINPSRPEICNDGIDNDCDALIDAADPSC